MSIFGTGKRPSNEPASSYQLRRYSTRFRIEALPLHTRQKFAMIGWRQRQCVGKNRFFGFHGECGQWPGSRAQNVAEFLIRQSGSAT